MSEVLGNPHIHHAVCESTNALLKELAEQGAGHGTTITADEQTAGRGRQGRTWVAPPGSALLMSVLVRPVEPRHTLRAAGRRPRGGRDLRGADAAEGEHQVAQRRLDRGSQGRRHPGRGAAGSVARTIVDGRRDRPQHLASKCAELPAELQQTAASLGLPHGHDALTPLLERLEHWLSAGDQAVLDAWRPRDALNGRRVGWADGEGVATGVDEHGNLVVTLDDGSSQTLTAGEVHLSMH